MKNGASKTYLLPCIGFILSLDIADLHAANLITNGDFDVDIAGWDIGGTCLSLGRDTFGPGNTDGALAINCFTMGASKSEFVRQCVLVPATLLEFSAEVTNNGVPGPVAFGLSSYTSLDCSGATTVLVDPLSATIMPDDQCCGITWTALSRPAISVPPDAKSVLIDIVVSTPADVAIDKIHLNPYIFRNGFESEQ